MKKRTATWLTWSLALLSVSLAVASLVFSLCGVIEIQSAPRAGTSAGDQLLATPLEAAG